MKKFIKGWGPLILFIILLGLARLYVFTPFTVRGHSMDPTLADGQRLIASKISGYERFDIITCKEPGEEDTVIVKRIIGLPGDVVTMKDDVLTINGKTYNEPYLEDYKKQFVNDKLQKTYAYDTEFQAIAAAADHFTSDFYYEVPKGQYFVLGDDRLISKDSRIFGMVDADLMLGKAVFRFYPFDKIGLAE